MFAPFYYLFISYFSYYYLSIKNIICKYIVTSVKNQDSFTSLPVI